jgi:hypothetical protein
MKGMLACLLSLALVFSCFTTVDAKADTTSTSGATVTAPTAVTATYQWSTNTLRAGSAAYVYVLKAETGNNIKVGATAKQMAKADGDSDYSIALTDLGVKKENKDAYFYVCDKEFEAAGTNITANFVIKATAAKKVTAVIDYTKADNELKVCDVISATVVDTKGATVKEPKIYWSTEINGTYYDVTSTAETAKRKYSDEALKDTTAPDGFDGQTLREMYGNTIYVKVAGVDGVSKTAQFASKAVKVKISKQTKATAMKIDVKKDTISLKNGFDFALAEKDDKGEYKLADGHWHTILPYLKSAAVKDVADSIVDTTAYTPLGKKESNAGKKVTVEGGFTYSYTSLKVKTLSIEALFSYLDLSDETLDDGPFVIAVRKSASEKKPVSEVSYIEVGVQAECPIVYTQDNVEGQFLVASSTDFAKKGISVGTIVPHPGNVSGEDTIATIGYDDTFEVGKTSDSGAKIANADNGGSSFEYAIVQSKDLEAYASSVAKTIDWTSVSWKKLDPAKTKITGKLKTKYTLIDGTKVTATLDTVSAQVTDFSKVKTFLVVRRAGVKSGNTRPSDYIKLYVAKEGTKYNLYSTVDNGAAANKHTIKFSKFSKKSDGTYGWQAATDVEDISVWVAENDKKYVSLPEIASGKLFTASSISGEPDEVVSTVSGEPNKGKYEINGNDTGSSLVKYMAIREYANVTVKQVISGDTSKEIIIYQQKDGKKTYENGAASSGEATLFVGQTLSISGGTVSSISGYVLANGTPANSGEVTFATGTGATVATVSKAINTAEEVVIVIPYTATAQYDVTIDDSKANGTVTVQKKGSDGNFVAVTLTEKKVTLDKGTIIKVIDTPASGKKLTKATFNGAEGDLSEGVVTSKEITVDKALTIAVVGDLEEAASSSGSEG